MTTDTNPQDPPDPTDPARPPDPPDPPDQSGSADQSPPDQSPADEVGADAAQRHTTSPSPSGRPPDSAPTTGGGSAHPPPGGPGFDYQPPPRARTARLQRSSSDKMLAGVCGGLRQHTGIDPILFRIGFVALVFAGGTGILLYIALAVLMPRDDGQPIWSRASRRPRSPGDGDYESTSGYGPDQSYGPPPPPVPQGPRSPVPGVTLAILLIGVGVVALGERYGDWSLDPSAYLAIALALVGIALLVSAFGPWRRSKGGLITLGVILSFALFASSALDGRGGFDEATYGERNYRPLSADQVRDTYQVLMGQSTLDLSDLQFTATDPTEIQVDVTMGFFEVLVSADIDVEVRTSTAFGSVSVFNDRNGNGGLSTRDGYFPGIGEGPGVGDDEPELVLDIDARLGSAEVTRAS